MKQYSKWFTYFILIIFTSIFYPLVMHGMNSDDAEKRFNIRSLPVEIYEKILLAQDKDSMRDVMTFLGSQPVTLAKHVKPHFVKIEDDHVVTKRLQYLTGYWVITQLWDIHTGKCLKRLKEKSNYEKIHEVGYGSISRFPVVNDSISMVPYTKGTGNETRPHFRSCICIQDTQTKQKLWYFEVVDSDWRDRVAVAIDGDNAVMAFKQQGKVCLWNKNNPIRLITLQENYEYGSLETVALCGNAVVIGFKDGYLEVMDANSGKRIQVWYAHKGSIQSIVLCGNVMITGSADCTAKIWEIGTGNELHTLSGPNGHTHGIDLVAMNDDRAVTASKAERTVKIWPLKVDFDLLAAKHPLFWIIHEADMMQLNFIWRAYAATIAHKKFFIDLPKKLGKIKDNETQEQRDGRLYFTMPDCVREYLRKRLTIRRSNIIRKTSSKLLKMIKF